MAYDPFIPGPHRVGEHEDKLIRDERGLPVTVWWPEARGPHPLVLYSHSSYGERRQSEGLLAHLSSHGYVVAAADHIGNTRADWDGPPPPVPLTPEQRQARLDKIIGDRVPDLRALLDHTLARHADSIDRERLGLVGWSFGGWAVLATLESDERFASVVAHAPAGGSDPLPGIIPATLTFRWKRDVPTLLLAAEQDRFIPWKSVAELHGRAPSAKRMFVLRGADHGHFADVIESDLPCPPDAAHHFTRGLTLAHLDATLKGDAEARRFLDGDVVAALRARAIDGFAYPER
jgi:dienelactone hydrolase